MYVNHIYSNRHTEVTSLSRIGDRLVIVGIQPAVICESLCAALTGNTPFDHHTGQTGDYGGGCLNCAVPAVEIRSDRKIIVGLR